MATKPSEVSSSSTKATTRANSKELVKKLYTNVGFDSGESGYLLKKGYKSPDSVLMAYKRGHIDSLESNSEFSQGSCQILYKLGQYLDWYKSAHGSYAGLDENFTKDAFETFNADKVTIFKKPDIVTKSDIVKSETPKSESPKIRISDFPTYSGKYSDWPRFYEKFTAVSELQGFVDILQEDIDHPIKFVNDLNYKEKCHQLYSILKNCCAAGTALPKINAYREELDQYNA